MVAKVAKVSFVCMARCKYLIFSLLYLFMPHVTYDTQYVWLNMVINVKTPKTELLHIYQTYSMLAASNRAVFLPHYPLLTASDALPNYASHAKAVTWMRR